MDLSVIGEQSPVIAVSDADSSTAQDSQTDNDDTSSFMEDVINDVSPQVSTVAVLGEIKVV